MEYGAFKEQGSQYVVTTPRTPARWFNYLFNSSYYTEVSQTFGGAVYRIEVDNPEGIEQGDVRLTVDGREWSEPYLPCCPGAIYEVRATIQTAAGF